MDMNNKSSHIPLDVNDRYPDPLPTPATRKKPYVKPSFRYEKVFETTALSCGKTPNSSFQCNTNPKTS
jgi:hypothetical protein